MAKIPGKIKDKACVELINRVYEAASSWDGSAYTISTTCSDKKRHYLGMSGIGKKCERSLWYGFRGFNPLPMDGRVRMIFELGHHIEQIQIYWLESAGYRITDRQVSYHDVGGLFRGHPDGIIHGITSEPHVWDAKSINKAGLESLKRLGMQKAKPIYFAQSQMMMHYSGTKRAVYTFMCKDNAEWYAERFYYDPDIAHALIEKALRIISANSAPPKQFEKKTMECQWCDYRLMCWNPKETIMSEKVCGTCFYLGFKKGTCTPFCKHPDHPFEILTWGISCADWLHLYHKEIEGREQYPEKVKI